MVQILLGTKSSATFAYFLALSVEDTLLLLLVSKEDLWSFGPDQ